MVLLYNDFMQSGGESFVIGQKSSFNTIGGVGDFNNQQNINYTEQEVTNQDYKFEATGGIVSYNINTEDQLDEGLQDYEPVLEDENTTFDSYE